MSVFNRVLPLSLTALMALGIAACESGGTVTTVKKLEGGEALITSADVRTVNWTSARPDRDMGGVVPNTITCAEPSPDVAKAVSEAFNASASLAAQSVQGVDGQAALAMSRAHAESIAQLGERLATVQLLRDGLYRACEAFANGAISEITYAVMVARYDDTVVTLMTSELAAGAFGRSLATLSGDSGGSSKASADVAEKIAARHEAERSLSESVSQKSNVEQSLAEKRNEQSDIQNELEETRKQQGNVSEELAAAQAAGAPDSEVGSLEAHSKSLQRQTQSLETDLQRTNKEISELQTQRDEVDKQIDEKNSELTAKLEAEADSRAAAGAVAAGGIAVGGQKAEIAEVLHEIQRKYIENINSDAIEVACVTAMSQSRETPLSKYCQSGALEKMAAIRHEILKTKLERSTMEKEYAARRLNRLVILQEVQELLKAAEAIEAGQKPSS